MVLLVYPLKDLIPNSTAILSYKLLIKQFFSFFFLPSCETPIQTFVTSTNAKHIFLKCQPKIVLQKGKEIDCDLHKKYSK